MTDKNCNCELNKQIQGLQARLSQAENNIHAQYIGTSKLVMGLLNTPAAGAAALVAGIYNLNTVGFTAMQKLIDSFPSFDTKNLMMQASSNLIGSMSAELDALVDGVEAAALNNIASAVSNLNASIDAVSNAATALSAARLGGDVEAITSAEIAHTTALASHTTAQQLLDTATEAKAISSKFMRAQANIAKCTTKSVHITK